MNADLRARRCGRASVCITPRAASQKPHQHLQRLPSVISHASAEEAHRPLRFPSVPHNFDKRRHRWRDRSDRRRALLVAALAAVRVKSRAPELDLIHGWLDSWTGLGLVVVGMQHHSYDVTLIFDKLLEMRRSGFTLMVVEQNATRALGIADRGYVLELGKNRFEGPGQRLLADPEVKRLYLGG